MIQRVSTREALLDLMPKNGRCVEVGVLQGSFSKEILKRCDPSYLILVDPWKAQPETHYDDINNLSQEECDKNYASVCEWAFADERLQTVDVRRQFSLDAARLVMSGDPEWKWDFCFIDANHSFGNTFADLVAWSMNVKSGGYLAVHDYTGPFYGVRQAVTEFCKVTGYEITHQTQEQCWQTVAIQIK